MLVERPTPTKVWKQVHRDIIGRLGLPCKLRCSNKHRVGGHDFNDDDASKCYISVNPTVAFRQPAHLILHEAAHHIVLAAGSRYCGRNNEFDVGCWFGHCEHWAKVLLKLYRKLGIPLPLGTQFETFAKIAGIQIFTREGAIRND
jgi:hypothetical protein